MSKVIQCFSIFFILRILLLLLTLSIFEFLYLLNRSGPNFFSSTLVSFKNQFCFKHALSILFCILQNVTPQPNLCLKNISWQIACMFSSVCSRVIIIIPFLCLSSSERAEQEVVPLQPQFYIQLVYTAPLLITLKI